MPEAPAEAAVAPGVRHPLLRECVESVIVAVIIALFVRAFVFQTFQIPTSSMETNLLVGDHLLVNKAAYSPSFGPLEDLLLGKQDVRRGHVVVFKYPQEPARDFVKRVIGLPGDKLEIRDKQVYVNGQALAEPYAHFLEPPRRHDAPDYGLAGEDTRDNWGPRVVPEGQLFVLGDNRDNSRDSRFWGFLPRDQLKGRALLVYWSYEATKAEYQPTGLGQWLKDTASSFGRTRRERFFHLIR